MSNLLATIRHEVGHRVGRFRAMRRARREREAQPIAAIEQVTDAIDPCFRLIRGYARKLRPAVEQMLIYADAACARLPGPVEFSRRSWNRDATVRAPVPYP